MHLFSPSYHGPSWNDRLCLRVNNRAETLSKSQLVLLITWYGKIKQNYIADYKISTRSVHHMVWLKQTKHE